MHVKCSIKTTAWQQHQRRDLKTSRSQSPGLASTLGINLQRGFHRTSACRVWVSIQVVAVANPHSSNSKQSSEYFDPCQEAATRSIKCMHRNAGDKDMCQDYFQCVLLTARPVTEITIPRTRFRHSAQELD
ncbi:uncharacterized protein A1O9_10239 [Exophiala aquamarina CBS 119918]|uniref:Uncharacterized protein n=1 Tax=Exophiala aquamarina CBS 119918 TaxID=1182545 RepID=A0A072P2C5_9EURO|nr:uncharacterized protein A1O9_10239 [Exophiala aquamarina CBS 119918]KEF53837.1 hypothetical protein A1O9_10239 [Exophiala aquamarina CBS 119918]